MPTKEELIAICKSIVDHDAYTPQINAKIAMILGWKDVRWHGSSCTWRGTDPDSWEVRQIPNFYLSVDAAILVIPPHWVESYIRRHNGSVRVELHPRGDLGLNSVFQEANDPASGILIAALSARILTLDKLERNQT